ncbi:hypothetical protein LMG27174_03432 [Paraburkholderia rhynchosiae]|uniref:Uncharacterized protein n=1 Tax=Paraburkholderia rhynchosiae TaxID=487049 RepID=A0A6J5B887_9BURK|nr:hypothetical protein LMG27174_03432 [Paraburkholderia rhynchosiae]
MTAGLGFEVRAKPNPLTLTGYEPCTSAVI